MSGKSKVIIIDSDDTARSVLKNYLKSIECAEFLAEFANNEAALDFVATQASCIVVLDVSDDFEKKLELISQIKNANNKAVIVAKSNKMNSTVVIKTMRAGANEFLESPVTETAFKKLMGELVNYDAADCAHNACKVISVFSNKGGIGKTSIAVNLAIEIAEMTKEKVAIVDLNLQLGDVSTFLDINPAFDLSYLAKNHENMDNNALLGSITRYKNSSLYVIADPVNIETSKDISAEQIQVLMSRLKRIFSYIIIDTSTSIDSKTISALEMSQLILLAAVVNLPAIRNLQRCMDLFDKLNFPAEKVKLVLNRYMDNEEIKTSDIEDVVKQKVYWKIPNNYLAMMSAVNKGVPVSVVNPDSNIAVNYKDFAAKLCDYLIYMRRGDMDNRAERESAAQMRRH